MKILYPTCTADGNKTKAQLLQAIAQLRNQLACEQQQRQALSDEIFRLNSQIGTGEDQRARLKAEQALRDSELFYRQTLESIPGMVFTSRPDGYCDYQSRQWVEYSGVPMSEHLGDGWTRLLHPEDRPRAYSAWRDAVENSAHYDLEYRVRRHDGAYEWFKVIGRPIRDAEGRIVRWFGVTMNIEDLKRAGEALRESEKRWAVTLDSIGDAVIATDMEGRITFLNKVAEELTGWRMAEAVSRPVKEVFRIVHEYTRAPVENPVTKVLESGVSVGLANHTVLIRKDGVEVPIDDSGAPIREQEGRVLGVVLIFRDISARRAAENLLVQSERRYRSLFQSMEAFGLFEPVLNAQGKIIDFRYLEINEAGSRLRGRTDEEIRGRTILEMFPRVDPYWIEAYAQVLLTGQPMQFERRNPGVGRWFRTYAYCPEQGKVASLILDITDRVEAEQALQELTATLEQQVAERAELAEVRAKQLQTLAVELIEAEERERRRVADLLHDDLQQILASARMQLQAACEKYPPDTMLANVERLLAESIGKSRRLSHELSPAVLHHSGLITALEWLARQMHEQFGLTVELETQAEHWLEREPLKVFIFRAVQELLFNIVKHAGVKSACVLLACSERRLTVTVSDQGRGFNPANICFATANAGFGLLSLRERASYIGGSLTIESAPGLGSRFMLKVPLDIAVAEETHPLALAPERLPLTPNVPVSPHGTTATRVLFADDHKVMRQGLIRLIEGQPDIEVVGEAANGRQALDRVRQLRPDVVVMDISMPVMDGVEATRRIKSEFNDVRVIGLSMFEDEHIARVMHEAGAEAFVSKTASSSELLKAIYGKVGPKL